MKCALVALGLVSACGDNHDGPTTIIPPKGLIEQLQSIQGVTVEETPTDTPGYTYFVLHFTQPVDHANPDGQTFQQEVSLIHRDIDAPMIVQTSGYWDYYLDHPVELTNLLLANQISIEHRFFGESRPEPADWSKLTIEQMADDEHAIIAALRDIYPGAFVTTGGSKGGMTATYHRRFYPEDVDASVPYVAPISFAAPDNRYTAFVDQIGPQSCRNALRAAAVEMLQHRRAAIEARVAAQPGHTFTRIPIGPAVESSIASMEWAFWQYYGIDYCDQVPATDATDDDMFDFLDTVAPVGDSDDVQVAAFEAYYFQAYAQLGYPADNATYLTPFRIYDDADYVGGLPNSTVPSYDGGTAMEDVSEFIKTSDKFLFVYGEWDPWTGGKYDLGGATDSALFVQPEGTHGSRIRRLATVDKDAAFEMLEAWTGVTPIAPIEKPGLVARDVKEPRIPPYIVAARGATRGGLRSPR